MPVRVFSILVCVTLLAACATSMGRPPLVEGPIAREEIQEAINARRPSGGFPGGITEECVMDQALVRSESVGSDLSQFNAPTVMSEGGVRDRYMEESFRRGLATLSMVEWAVDACSPANSDS